MPTETFFGIDVSCQEQDGEVVVARWKAKVRLASVVTTDPAFSLEIFLQPGLTGLPAPGHTETINGVDLELAERKVKILDSRTAEVELVYRKPEFGSFGGPQASLVYQGGSVLETIETENDKDGNQITLTFDGITQGGKIAVQEPRLTHTVQVIEETDTPEQYQMAWLGRVNSQTWKSGAPGTWICDQVSFQTERTDTTPNQHLFTYGFKFNAKGWQPEAVFIDNETGKPPIFDPQNDEDVAYKEIDYYDTAHFGAKFT